MARNLFTTAALLLAITDVRASMGMGALPPPWARGGELWATLQQQGAAAAPTNITAVAAETLTAPLDHFNASDARTMPVRYWIVDECYKPGGPVFVVMGGEAGARAPPNACNARAKQYGAIMVFVEHRFYGQSVPEGGLSDANLPFLTVEQNLADTKMAVETVRATILGAKVIAFGGSYSGATCAWFRLAYPDLVDGCVSESGVVNTVFDFVGFDEHVLAALDVYAPPCGDALRGATAALERAFARDGGGAAAKRQFNASNLVGTKLGDPDFFYAVADGPAMMVQYGSKVKLCDGLARLPAAPTDAERIANLAAIVAQHYGPAFVAQCFYDSECFKKPDQPEKGIGARQWRWEKCNEVAYLQAAPAKTPVRSSTYMTIDNLVEQCAYVFGAAAVNPKRGAAATLARYGGVAPHFADWNRKQQPPQPQQPPNGDRPLALFFINYSDDPWQRAGVTAASNPAWPASKMCMATCTGCGHCGAGADPKVRQVCEDEANVALASWLAA